MGAGSAVLSAPINNGKKFMPKAFSVENHISQIKGVYDIF